MFKGFLGKGDEEAEVELCQKLVRSWLWAKCLLDWGILVKAKVEPNHRPNALIDVRKVGQVGRVGRIPLDCLISKGS